jgi:hypothetical protein
MSRITRSYYPALNLNPSIKKVPEITDCAGTFLWILNRKGVLLKFIRFPGGFEYKELKEKPQALTQITGLPQILDH